MKLRVAGLLSLTLTSVAAVVFAQDAERANRQSNPLPAQNHTETLDRSLLIAVIMKHVSGNLISNWTDFLAAVSEKPSRNRDDEFIDSFTSRAELTPI
jgi:hypothetical protein